MKYVSVIGTGVTGSLTGGRDGDSASKRGEENGLTGRLESLVAYSSYSVLSGEGEGSLGDGKSSQVKSMDIILHSLFFFVVSCMRHHLCVTQF